QLTGIKSEEIYAIGTDLSASKTINQQLGKNEAPLLDDLLKTLSDQEDVKIILVDEVGKMQKEELEKLAEAVVTYNKERDEADHVKVILLGDPNQINISGNRLSEKPDIET